MNMKFSDNVLPRAVIKFYGDFLSYLFFPSDTAVHYVDCFKTPNMCFAFFCFGQLTVSLR